MCRIFFNPRYSTRPRGNSIAHELAHIILEHEPGAAVTHGALSWMASASDIPGGAAHVGVSAPSTLARTRPAHRRWQRSSVRDARAAGWILLGHARRVTMHIRLRSSSALEAGVGSLS
jgi:hypothetical protein